MAEHRGRHRGIQRYRRGHGPPAGRRGIPRRRRRPPRGPARSAGQGDRRRHRGGVRHHRRRRGRRPGRRSWPGWTGRSTLLVNNAGGARGMDPVASGSVDDWQWMYDVNVLGTLRVTQALLPALEAAATGTIVTIGSTAAFTVYEGGGGYTAAKHAQTALVGTLRLEIVGKPVRVIEIDPGMVRTEEFSLNRLRRRGQGGRGLRRRAGAADRRRHRRLRRLVRHPPAPRQHRPPGGPADRPGRPAQGAPRAE